MAYRAEPADIIGFIREYDGRDIQVFRKLANVLTDQVAAQDSESELSSTVLDEIEALLGAHFYHALVDHDTTKEKTDDAAVEFTAQYGKGLKSTGQGQAAIILDTTGYLASVSEGATKVGVSWLGKAPDDQTDAVDRGY